jgi:hypothetical protein
VVKRLGVPAHAGVGWWHARESGVLDRNVAATAVETDLPHLMFVAEQDRLLHRPARADLAGEAAMPDRYGDRRHHPRCNQPDNESGTGSKGLRHVSNDTVSA